MSTYCERCKMHIVDAHDPTKRCPVDDCPFNVPPDRFKIVGEIAKLRLIPGDVLVVRTETPITTASAKFIKEEFGRVLPEGVNVVVVHGMDLSVLTQDDPLGISRQ